VNLKKGTMRKITKHTLTLALTGLIAGGAAFAAPGGNQDNNHPSPAPAPSSATVTLLKEFRPIGGVSNNLVHPNLDVVPYTPEVALTPPNYAPGTSNGLVNGPNPRTISNIIAGGTGANGQNGETDDPVASAWLYVFGQFVDHDIDLEETPPDSPAINIVVPTGDPVFAAGTVIAMTRDTMSPVTGTIINTVAGYLDLSQLYGITTDISQCRWHAGLLRQRPGAPRR
jgi:peroxidase